MPCHNAVVYSFQVLCQSRYHAAKRHALHLPILQKYAVPKIIVAFIWKSGGISWHVNHSHKLAKYTGHYPKAVLARNNEHTGATALLHNHFEYL